MEIKQKLQKHAGELNKKIDSLEKEAMKTNKKLNEVYRRLHLIKKREHDNPNSYINLNTAIKDMLKVLDERNYPKIPICNHFGVSYTFGEWRISISDYGLEKDKICIIFSVEGHWVGHKEVGCSKVTFDRIRENLRKDFEIESFWNGDKNNRSMTVIIKKNMPRTFLKALLAYHNKRIFNGVTDNFGRKFDRNFKKFMEVKDEQ